MAGGDDDSLGLNQPISRRDFVNGAAIGIAAATLPGCDSVAKAVSPADYPPLRTGMRGSHAGSFEAAHMLRDAGQAGAPRPIDIGETYDLVIVGGGISGLAAAHFWREAEPQARILILENHDDFGGHAKRNEFRSGATTLIGTGGTLGIDSPRPYSTEADGLLRAIGIDVAAMKGIEKEDFYHARGLGRGVFFDKATFGADHLAVGAGDRPWPELLADAPLSPAARRDIARIEAGGADYWPGLSSPEKKDRLSRMSYRAYLADVAKADAAALAYYQTRSHGWWCVGIDAVPALDAWAMTFPGFAGLKLDKGGTPRMGYTPQGFADTGGSYALHFPDGNATVARTLVHRLIPAAIGGTSVADGMTAHVDYAALDRPDQPVRLRLSSIALAVRHDGPPDTARAVDITYATGKTLHTVRGARVIMASWAMMMPHMIGDLPEAQKAALHDLVKGPLVYTNVVLRDWRAFDRLKVSSIAAPGSFFSSFALNETVDIGAYASPRDPAQPILVRLNHMPCAPGLPEHDQNRAGRAALLATPFATFERHIRDQMGRALGAGGFDPARDITAITVNRWPHGYAPEFNALWEPLLPESEQPHVVARQRFGRIAIANADAGRSGYTSTAIDQAHRAVRELIG